MKRIVIGLGTGRCGTYTLARLLDSQDGFTVTHEMYALPWKPKVRDTLGALIGMLTSPRKFDVVGDTGFYWINSVPDIIEYAPHTKFVCLYRNKDEVVKSFDNRTKNENWWTRASSKHWDWNKWDLSMRVMMFPKYDLPKLEALGEYWEEYNRRAQVWARKFPDNFKIYTMKHVLNDKETQKNMLNFIGIDEDKHKYILNEKLNATRSIVVEERRLDIFKNTNVEDNFAKNMCGFPGCEAQAAWQLHNRNQNILMYACPNCRDKVVEHLRQMSENSYKYFTFELEDKKDT